jgi:MFS family permease
MPSFDMYFGHYNAALKELYLDSIWTSLWSSMSNVGSILGSALAGPLSQRFGRKYGGIGFGVVTVCCGSMIEKTLLMDPDLGCGHSIYLNQ